jgi:hypothetical protein
MLPSHLLSFQKYLPNKILYAFTILPICPAHPPPCNVRGQECVELYLHSPNTSWHGAWLSTGTTLPYIANSLGFIIRTILGSPSSFKVRTDSFLNSIPINDHKQSSHIKLLNLQVVKNLNFFLFHIYVIFPYRAPRHEGVLDEWSYSFKHSWTRR